MVETDTHGLFEVRFHRLAHQGDDNVFEHAAEDGQINAFEEACRMYEKFTSLGLYYSEANRISSDYCPAFYRFKIAPFQSVEDIPHRLESQRQKLNRVYEVEEYMGETLIVGISRHHADYLE
jgi:hypothetical protein